MNKAIDIFIMIIGAAGIVTSEYIMLYISISRYNEGNIIVELFIFVASVIIFNLPLIQKQ